MRLVVSLEFRFDRTPDGRVWTQTMFPYSFWMRYLNVFDRLRVVARVRNVKLAEPDWVRADGERVSFEPLPHYIGPWQYVLQAPRIHRSVKEAIGPEDAVILRVGSQIAATIEPMLRKSQRPFGLEVVGDPYDTFAPGAMKHPLRPFFRWSFARQLRQQCSAANLVAYVTEQALQRRYPPAASAFSTHYSSIDLPASAFVSAPRAVNASKRSFTLVTVGTLAQLYKAPDVLLDAVADCERNGLDVNLILIGDGKHRQELEVKAKALGLNEKVGFLGQLPAGDSVRAQLDTADVFVLPSRQEGLPRAIIEAMARALPCIGSTVGGIPELLPAEDMVPPNDSKALARKIWEIVTDPRRMARMSARNLEKAKEYKDDILRGRRTEFYRYLRTITEDWLRSKPDHAGSPNDETGTCQKNTWTI
jgi:glycosyltransferase involved in cell wall biosynthesis